MGILEHRDIVNGTRAAMSYHKPIIFPLDIPIPRSRFRSLALHSDTVMSNSPCFLLPASSFQVQGKVTRQFAQSFTPKRSVRTLLQPYRTVDRRAARGMKSSLTFDFNFHTVSNQQVLMLMRHVYGIVACCHRSSSPSNEQPNPRGREESKMFKI
jgi:hypothetical protein